MRIASTLLVLAALTTACRLEHASTGRPPGPPTAADSLARVEQDSSLNAEVLAALRSYYERLSARDWRGVRSAFAAGGIVTTTLTAQGERADRPVVLSADDFIRRPPEGSRSTIFSTRLLHAHILGYGDLADAWVIYEGRWGQRRDSLRTERGIGAFQLYRDRGTWRIVSLTLEPEDARRVLVPPVRRPARRATPAGSTPRSGT